MRNLVIITGSSTSIVSSSRYHHQHHFFNPKQSHIFSLSNPISVSLPKLPSPSPTPPSCSSPPSSTSLLLTPPLLDPLNGDYQSDKLGSYADYASKLVEYGQFEDFGMVVKSVLGSGVGGVSDFGRLLNLGIVMRGIGKGLREGRIRGVVEFLGWFPQLGIDVLGLFDGSAMELVKRECLRLVNSGNLEEAVEVMEALAGFQFPIRGLIKPSDMIRVCVDKRHPILAVRYA